MDEFLALLETVLRVFEVNQSPQTFLVLIGLAFARLLSFLVIVPFFGGASVPARVKVATATAFVIIVYPALAAGTGGQPLGFGPLGFAALLAKEVCVGFTLGYVASLVFEAVQVSGRIIDLQRGSTLSELFAPQLQAQVSELGQFKVQFAVMLFLVIGAHRPFLAALMQSFDVIPATTFPQLGSGWTPLAATITALSGQVLAVGVQLAAPAIVALLLTDVCFGVINRVAPQINVFFLSLPVKMAVGLLLVLLALPLYRHRYEHFFEEAIGAFRSLIQAAAQGF